MRAGFVLPMLWLAAGAAASQAPPPAVPLGLCPAEARQRDSYTQALCDGEQALRQGNSAAALDRFRFAANLPRPSATNELAWAGLAAAHCAAGEVNEGRRWAGHFDEARRLWQGELDCQAGRGPPQPSQFVQVRMCGEGVAGDYALVRSNAQAMYAQDLYLRLKRIDEALRRSCSGAAVPATAAQTAPAAAATETPQKKSKKKKPPQGSSSKPAS
jgi:hypothetical protein